MVNINVSATGDAAGAIAAIEALKASIASVTGKTVKVRVEVDGNAAAIAGLGRIGRARDDASGDIVIGTRTARTDIDGLSTSARGVARDIDRASRDGAAGMSRLGREAASTRHGVSGLIREADGFKRFSGAELGRMSEGLSRFSLESKRAARAAGGGGGAVPPIDDLGASLGGAGDRADGMGRSMARAVGSLNLLGRTSRFVVMAGAVTELGALAVGAVTAGVGLGSVFGVVASSQPLMAEAKSTLRGFTDEFKEASGAAGRVALPMFGALKTEVRGLGEELASIGVSNLDNTMGGATSLARTATAALKQLEPAIGPSIDAAFSLGRVVAAGLGDASPGIEAFANSITRNERGLQGLVTGLTNFATGFGSGVSDVAGTLGTVVGAPNPAAAFHRLAERADAVPSDKELPPEVREADRDLNQRLGASRRPDGSVTYSSSPDNKFGQVMHALGATGSLVGTAVGAYATDLGGTIRGERAPELHRAGDEFNKRWGELLGGGAGAPAPRPAPSPVAPPAPPPVEPPPAASWEELLGGPVTPQPRVGSSFGGMVRRQIQDAAPEVEQAGAALGGSAGAGLDQGIQSSVTRTETVMRKTIRKVIDVAADEMDAHSPSREFEKLGFSAPQGLAVGFERGASLAESASARVTQGVIAAAADATALTRAGQAAGQSYATGLGTGMAPAGSPPPVSGPGARNLGDQATTPPAQDPGLAQQADAAARQPQAAAARQQRATDARAAAGVAPGAGSEEFGPQDTFTARQEAHNRRAEDIRERAQRNKERAMRQANPEMTDSQFSRMLDTRAPGKTSFTYSTYTPSPSPSGEGPNPGGVAAARARSDGKDVGMSYTQGQKQGLDGGAAAVQEAAKRSASRLDRATREQLLIRSPSRLAASAGSSYAAGLGAGMAGAIGSASDGIRGVADNSGLKLGNVWGRSVVTGADAVIQKDLFQAMSVPTLESPRAKAALAAAGLLGPAGSGASIWKTPAVSFGAAPAAPQPVVMNAHFRVELDGQPFREMTITQIDEAMDTLASAITMQ